MAIVWACRESVETYAGFGRRAPAPRIDCSTCHRPLAFDGAYSRQVREAGAVHRVFVRRVRCRGCGTSDVLLPSFVVKNRLDSASSIGAAVLVHTGHVTEDVMELCRGVPARTLRSWRQRFADTADALTSWLSALCVEWGGLVPTYPAEQTDRAISAIVAVSRAIQRRRSDAPPAWILANVITGGQVMANRVDLPRPGVGSRLPSNHKGKVITSRSHQTGLPGLELGESHRVGVGYFQGARRRGG